MDKHPAQISQQADTGVPMLLPLRMVAQAAGMPLRTKLAVPAMPMAEVRVTA